MRRLFALLVIVFVISRIWAYSVGVRFDDYSNTSNIHLYATEAMKENLWESLWFGHAQPPIYSLLMHLTGMNGMFVHILWMILGMTAGYAIFKITLNLTRQGVLSGFAALIWMICPSTILFENLIFYTYPTACMLIFAAWAIQRGHLITFSVLCCMICLTRSLFHPFIWLTPCVILASYLSLRRS